jgi:3-oxoacyl-[acyl-carrier protein] reductase
MDGVDILINNAARHLKKYNQPFSSLTHQEIRSLFDVNLMGIINCSLACKPSMSDRGGGAIVNMSSAGGYMSSTPYGVTKLAVRGLTIAFATEFSSAGIRVNAIAPTIIPTDGVLSEYSDMEIDQLVNRRQLVRRRGQLADVTSTMLFLCSEDASFITGETIRVTGGASLSI